MGWHRTALPRAPCRGNVLPGCHSRHTLDINFSGSVTAIESCLALGLMIPMTDGGAQGLGCQGGRPWAWIAELNKGQFQ